MFIFHLGTGQHPATWTQQYLPNGTEAQIGHADADADVPGRHTFGGGVLPDDWVEILRGMNSERNGS